MLSRRHLVSWTYCKKLYCSKGFILDQLKGKLRERIDNQKTNSTLLLL